MLNHSGDRSGETYHPRAFFREKNTGNGRIRYDRREPNDLSGLVVRLSLNIIHPSNAAKGRKPEASSRDVVVPYLSSCRHVSRLRGTLLPI